MKLIFVNRYFSPDISATSRLLSDLTIHLAPWPDPRQVEQDLVLGPACKKNVDDVRESPAAHAKLLVDTRGRYWKNAGNIAYTIERLRDR